MIHFGDFLKSEACGQIVLPDRSLFNRTEIGGKCQNSNATFWVNFKQCKCVCPWWETNILLYAYINGHNILSKNCYLDYSVSKNIGLNSRDIGGWTTLMNVCSNVKIDDLCFKGKVICMRKCFLIILAILTKVDIPFQTSMNSARKMNCLVDIS